LKERTSGDAPYVCSACRREYPVILGIPDFRVFADPYIGIEEDRAKGRKLAERFNDFDFRGFVEHYYSMTDVVPPSQAQRYIRSLLGAGARAEAALDAWEPKGKSATSGGALLEIGCGTAPLLIAAAARFDNTVGIDIAFRWLVVAKKRLTEVGLETPLFCACAEALPFRGGAFDRVVADSVLEVVADQQAALSEAFRVMRPGGRLLVATPNRFSIGPDPHIGLWAGGMMPRSVIERRARKLGAIPPKRNLLSFLSLRRLLRETGFTLRQIFLPDVPEGQRRHFPRPMQWLIAAYHGVKRLPVTRQLLYVIGPLLYAVAQKERSEPAVTR
jgi:SAM-dependent methyltransferase